MAAECRRNAGHRISRSGIASFAQRLVRPLAGDGSSKLGFIAIIAAPRQHGTTAARQLLDRNHQHRSDSETSCWFMKSAQRLSRSAATRSIVCLHCVVGPPVYQGHHRFSATSPPAIDTAASAALKSHHQRRVRLARIKRAPMTAATKLATPPTINRRIPMPARALDQLPARLNAAPRPTKNAAPPIAANTIATRNKRPPEAALALALNIG